MLILESELKERKIGKSHAWSLSWNVVIVHKCIKLFPCVIENATARSNLRSWAYTIYEAEI